MIKTPWLTGAVAVAAIGVAVALAPRPATAITFGGGGTCADDFETAAGAQSGGGTYSVACAVGGTLDNLIDGLSGDRANAANWSVMSGSYGLFDLANFTDSGNTKVTFLLHIAVNNHEFGWSDATGTDLHVLLPSTTAANVGDVVYFEPDEDPFLFYATNESDFQTGNTFFTDRTLNSFGGVDDFVHFLILEGDFGGRTEYLIAGEDLVDGCQNTGDCGNPDNDFNDAAVLVQVPEPATLALFGAGLLGLGLYRRRRP